MIWRISPTPFSFLLFFLFLYIFISLISLLFSLGLNSIYLSYNTSLQGIIRIHNNIYINVLNRCHTELRRKLQSLYCVSLLSILQSCTIGGVFFCLLHLYIRCINANPQNIFASFFHESVPFTKRVFFIFSHHFILCL